MPFDPLVIVTIIRPIMDAPEEVFSAFPRRLATRPLFQKIDAAPPLPHSPCDIF